MKLLCNNLYFCFFVIILTNCYAHGYEPDRYKINKDKKIVWDESLNFLVLNGFKIKTIDYDSGLIYSEKNIGGKNLGWDIKDKQLVSNGFLTCKKPPSKFVDVWVKGKSKFTMLNSDGYITVLLKTVDLSTEIILYIDGLSQWGPVVGSENPVTSSCESNDSLEKSFISYLNGGKNIFFSDSLNDKVVDDSDHIYRLDSGDFNQIRTDAIDIFTTGGVSNIEIYEKLDKIIKDNYKKMDNDSVAQDTLAWICKSLSTSSDPKYKVTLKEVAENATDRKVRKYAEWALSE